MNNVKELKARITKLEEKSKNDDDYIGDLEEDNGRLIDMVTDLKKENSKLKGTYRGDEWRIEQYNRNRAQEDQISKIEEMEYSNNLPLQLNLFEDK